MRNHFLFFIKCKQEDGDIVHIRDGNFSSRHGTTHSKYKSIHASDENHAVRICAAYRVELRSGMLYEIGENVGVFCVILRALRVAINYCQDKKGAVDASGAYR